MLLKHCLLLSVFAGLASSLDTQCAPSDDWGAELIDFEVENCKKGSPCLLEKGKNTGISINFKPFNDVKEVHTRVHGIMGGVPLPYTVPQPFACENSGLTCPLVKDEESKYKTELPVLSYYPSVSVKVKWELVDQDDKVLVCIMIPAKIVAHH